MLAIDHATPRTRDGSRRPDKEEKKKRQETGTDQKQAVSSGQGQIADGSQVAAGRRVPAWQTWRGIQAAVVAFNLK